MAGSKWISRGPCSLFMQISSLPSKFLNPFESWKTQAWKSSSIPSEVEPVIKAYFEERWAELPIAHIEQLLKHRGWV